MSRLFLFLCFFIKFSLNSMSDNQRFAFDVNLAKRSSPGLLPDLYNFEKLNKRHVFLKKLNIYRPYYRAISKIQDIVFSKIEKIRKYPFYYGIDWILNIKDDFFHPNPFCCATKKGLILMVEKGIPISLWSPFGQIKFMTLLNYNKEKLGMNIWKLFLSDLFKILDVELIYINNQKAIYLYQINSIDDINLPEVQTIASDYNNKIDMEKSFLPEINYLDYKTNSNVGAIFFKSLWGYFAKFEEY